MTRFNVVGQFVFAVWVWTSLHQWTLMSCWWVKPEFSFRITKRKGGVQIHSGGLTSPEHFKSSLKRSKNSIKADLMVIPCCYLRVLHQKGFCRLLDMISFSTLTNKLISKVCGESFTWRETLKKLLDYLFLL